MHFSSLARIEQGRTRGMKMRLSIQKKLAGALKIPVEYIQAACRSEIVETAQMNNVCRTCWTPGTSPDIRWSMTDASFANDVGLNW
jgi:hypothetical protein